MKISPWIKLNWRGGNDLRDPEEYDSWWEPEVKNLVTLYL
jgi:hypothetical protein